MEKNAPNKALIEEITGHVGNQFKTFPGKSWRKAIGWFLDAVWSSNHRDAGILHIGGVGLQLFEWEYRLQHPDAEPEQPRPVFERNQIDVFSWDRNSVEVGLARFIRDNQVKMAVFEFPCTRLMFWKGKEREELFFTAVERTF